MNEEKQKILEALFAPGDLRNAAICIDHYVMTTARAIHDEELAAVIIAAGMSIIGILSSLERGRSVNDVASVIDSASRQAVAELISELVARAFTQSAGVVQ